MTIKEFANKSAGYYDGFTQDPYKAAMLMHENAGHARMGGLYRSLDDVHYVYGGARSKRSMFGILCNLLGRDIDSEALETEKDKELLRAIAAEYRRRQCCGMNLLTCASCGTRQYDVEKSDYHDVEVKTLPDCFLLTDEQNVRMDALEKKKISLGKWKDTPENGCKVSQVVFEDVSAARAFSVYVAKCTKKRYHLHPEFVRESKHSGEITTFCDRCYTVGCVKKTAPPLSIAAGVDFGDAARLGLDKPNDHELSVLSLYRRFNKTIQFEENKGKSTNYTGRALKAHLVLFKHDAPMVAGEALHKKFIDATKLKEAMQVVFLGPDGKIDAMRLKAKEATHLFARPLVLHQWLSVLKVLNPEFRDLELPSYDEIEELVTKSVEDIIEAGRAVTDETIIRLQEKIGSDVAGARLADEDRVREDLRGGMIGGTSRAISTATVTYVTTKRMERTDDDNAENNGVFLEAARNALVKEKFIKNKGGASFSDGDVMEEWFDDDECPGSDFGGDWEESSFYENQEMDEIESLAEGRVSEIDWDDLPPDEDGLEGTTEVVNSTRESSPVDEFVKDDVYITGAFPTTFLLGRAYGKGVSGVGPKERIHLLRQFTCAAATDRGLQAYLFDHQLRFQTIAGVSACLRSQKGSMKKLAELVKNNEEFESQLKKAILRPAGKIAKDLLRLIMPLLSFAGRESSYGALERNAAICKVMAMCQRYGPGFIFLTISSNDLHNPLSYRLTFRAKNNEEFPATINTEEFMRCLREDTVYLGEGNVNIPCSYQERAMAAGDNPVAYVDEYRRGIFDIMTVILGRSPSLPGNDGCTGSTVRSTKYYAAYTENAGPMENRCSKGIFGTNLATYAVIEDHSKGTLHVHLILFGGIPGRILQGSVCVRDLCDKVKRCLDSMISCEIPPEFHYQNAMKSVLKEHHVSDDKLPTPPPPMVLRSVSNGFGDVSFQRAIADVGDRSAVDSATWSYCSRTQRHRHCETCKKGFLGCTGCRLCKPSNLKEETGATWVVPIEVVDPDTGKITDIIPEERSLAKTTWKDALPHLVGSAISEDGVPLHKMDRKLLVYEMQRKALPLLPDIEQESNDDEGDTSSENGAHERHDNGETERMKCVLEDVAGGNKDIIEPFFEWFESQSMSIQRRVYRFISESCVDANGYMTEYNPYLTLLTGCHAAALPLGGAEQALAAMFYLTGYVSKNKVEIEKSLAILKAAKDHIDKYPSTADDSGTTMRTTKHLLQRTLNRFNLMMEVSDHQIAASLLNLPTELCTDGFAYTNPKYHIALIDFRKKHGLHDTKKFQEAMEYGCTDDSTCKSNNESDDESDARDETVDGVDDESGTNTGTGIDTQLYDILGPAPFYSVDESGNKIPVPYPLHYLFRGKCLEFLNRHEYYTIVKIEKKKRRGVNTHLGRNAFRRFPLDPGHPLSASHEQYILAKQPVLVLCHLPRHPGSKPEDESNRPSWEKQAAAFAKFYLCMFRPEMPGVEYEYDWDTFTAFVKELEDSKSALSRLRLRAMETMIHSIDSTYSFKRALQLYRAKSRTRWSKKEKRRLAFEKYSESQKERSDFEMLEEEEYEKLHSQINRVTLERMERDIAYSDGLLGELQSKCCLGYKAGDTKPLQYSLLNKKSRKTKIAMDNLTKRDYGIDSSPEYTNDCRGVWAKRRRNLKPSQLRALDMAGEVLAETAKNAPPSRDGDKARNVMLITGPAGTGKSYVIRCIQELAAEKGRPHNSFANNAINAIHIDGNTIDSVFYPPALKRNQTEDDCHGCPTLKLDQYQELQTKLRMGENPIVVIDEISNVSPMKLVLIDMRLKELTGKSDQSFGGLAVFLVGDFRQCGPVGGTVVAKAVIDVAEYDRVVSKGMDEKKMGNSSRGRRNVGRKRNDTGASRYSTTSNYRQAADILRGARWCHLKEQLRNKDECHQRLLTLFERGCRIAMKYIRTEKEDLYQKLQKTDFDNKRDGWHRAPVLVSTHRERYTLTHFLAHNFALREGKRVYRWRSEEKKWNGKPSPIFYQDCVDSDPALWEYFVEGAPVYITDNIHKEIGLVNGTKAVFHSMTYATSEQLMEEKNAIERDSRLISLSSPPESVNVELEWPSEKRLSDPVEKAKYDQWIKKYSKVTIVEGRVVIPIPAERKKRNPWQNTVIRGSHGKWKACRVFIKRHFPLMPGFAITIHKAQGMTLKKVILAVGCRPSQFNLHYNSLYVAFSRVERAKDIRLLFPVGTNWSDLLYLCRLRPDPAIASYFAGYKTKDGNQLPWNADRALSCYDMLRCSGKMGNILPRKRGIPSPPKKPTKARRRI